MTRLWVRHQTCRSRLRYGDGLLPQHLFRYRGTRYLYLYMYIMKYTHEVCVCTTHREAVNWSPNHFSLCVSYPVRSTELLDLMQTARSGPQSARGTTPRTKDDRRRELLLWKKQHQAKVREKYQQELSKTQKPETRPFNRSKNLVSLRLGPVRVYWN